MDNRSRRVLRLVAGMYLVYLSYRLISEQLRSATSNAVVAWAAAIAFGVVGVFVIINYFKTSVKDFHEQENETEETVEEIEEKVDEE